jgi:hypothetical protein
MRVFGRNTSWKWSHTVLLGTWVWWSLALADTAGNSITPLEGNREGGTAAPQMAFNSDDLVAGIGFEKEGDLEQWSADEGITLSRSSDFAAEGHYSLKLHFPEGGDRVYFKPRVTDWGGFSELRLVAHNPDQRNLRYRVLRIVDEKGEHTNEGENTMPFCLIHLPPGETREFRLDLKKMPGVNLRNVTGINIFWGTDKSTIYLDKLRLWTAEEVRAEEEGKLQARVAEAITGLERVAKHGYHSGEVQEIRKQLTRLQAQQGAGSPSEYAPALEKASRLAALAAMLKGMEPEHGRVSDFILRGAPPTEQLFRDKPFAGRKGMALTLAGNERESFQVAILPVRRLETVRVSAGPLVLDGDPAVQIPATNVTLNPVGYIEVTRVFYFGLRTGFWPDPLMQLRPIDLEKEFQPYWVTVYAPAGQKSGLYRGEIRVTCANAPEQTFAYSVQVRNFSLPVRGKLRTFFDVRQPAATPAARQALYQFYFDHRLNPNSMYGSATSLEKMVPHPEDLEFCMERGLNNINLYYAHDAGAKDPFSFSQEYIDKMIRDLRPAVEFLRQHKALELATVYTCDEVMFDTAERQAVRLAEQRKLCTILKREFPDLKLVNCGPRMDISPELMDIYYLVATPAAKTQDIRAAGKQTAFYWAYENPSFMLDLPGTAARICSWLAFKEKSVGIAYYCTSRPWNGSHLDAANEPDGLDYAAPFYKAETNNGYGRNGCGHLIYLRKDGGFNSSIRLQNIRDGIEDYEYLAMLDELSGGQAAELRIPNSLVELQDFYWAQYTTDFDQLQAARNAVGDRVEKLLREKAGK